MQYSIVGNDIALMMHYHALLKRSDKYRSFQNFEHLLHHRRVLA